MKTFFKNGKIILPDTVLDGYNVLVEGNVISEITGDDITNADQIVDLKGRYLSPGFIDIHTHGAGGHDFMDGTEEAVVAACNEHLKHGTTSICPTTLTCANEELFHFFNVYRRVKQTYIDGPNLLGIHLEGPFFSSVQAGAQDPSYLQLPLPANYMPILDAGGDDIIRMSVAIELDGAMQLGDELSRRGIVAAIGHSDASYEQVKEAVQHGYSHLTHLYSCMSSLRRVGPYRILGIVESSYLIDELTVEIIADGKHLPPELLQLIVKCKDNCSISLITDAMRGAGMSEGLYVKLGSLKNGQDAIIRDGVAMMTDLKAFAGSICTADRCIRTMHFQTELSIEKAVKMMSLNPAKVIGIDARKGTLEKGKDADLVIFDENVNVSSVYVGGVLRFKAD